MSSRLRDLASGFKRTFWVANVLELFERFAFYGSKAVLTIYLATRVGLGPQAAGSLAGLFSGVLYFLPILAGTVASTTTPQTKALGYSIYYTMVNFGGAMGPILALQVRQSLGIEYVLVVSSITSFFCLLGTLIFFREPERAPGETAPTSFGKVLRDMLLVFRNGRFVGFLVIFSGFWIMFWQMFYSLPFYLTESLRFERFELIETVDAWTLILVTVPIAALVRRWQPIRAMTAGFFVASCSWLLIAFFHT